MNWISGKLNKKFLHKKAWKKEMLSSSACLYICTCLYVSVCMCSLSLSHTHTWTLMQWGEMWGKSNCSWSASVRREDSGIQDIGAGMDFISASVLDGLCKRENHCLWASRQEIWPDLHLFFLRENPKFGAYKKNKMMDLWEEEGNEIQPKGQPLPVISYLLARSN